MTGENAVEAGGRVGPYVLHGLIGRGGMGEVWRAADTVREREVALKLISPSASQDAAVATRFRRECRLAARLSSAHVVPIHDFGEIDDRLFLDMRLVPGPDLRSVLDRHPEGLDPEAVRDVIVQVADALDAAHDQELVHRDVKPSNVLVDVSRGRWFCYLADFGVAVPFDAGPDTRITRTGMTIGTPTYMAPELLIGDGRASVATDVYALGCLLYELLTGHPPYSGANDAAVLFAHAHAEPPQPSAHRPWLAGFDAVVRTALDKDPARRFASAGELARALPASPFVPAAAPGPPPTFVGGPAPVARPARPGRRRVLWAGLVLLLLAGLGAGGYALAQTTGLVETPPTQVTARRLAAFTGTYGVASSPDGRSVYLVGHDDRGHALFVVDATTGATLNRIPVTDGTLGLVVSPDGQRAYLLGSGYLGQTGRTVEVVDVPGSRAVATIDVGAEPVFATLSGDGSRLFVTTKSADDKKPGNLVVVDRARNLVESTIPVGRSPHGLAASPDGRRVYVANYYGDDKVDSSVSVVDVAARRVERTITTGTAPYDVRVAPDGRTLYVTTSTNASPGMLDVFDTESFGRTQIPVPTSFYPADAVMSPDGTRLLLTNFGTDKVPGRTITIMDLEKGTALPFAEIVGRPNTIAVTPDGHHAFVTTYGSSDNSLWILEFP